MDLEWRCPDCDASRSIDLEDALRQARADALEDAAWIAYEHQAPKVERAIRALKEKP